MEILNNYELLIKYKINYNQLFYMFLISNNLTAALYKFQNENPFPLNKEEVDGLHDLEYITEPWNGYFPDNAVLTKKGKKIFSKLVGENIEKKDRISNNQTDWFIQLFNIFPKYFNTEKFDAKGLKPSKTLDGRTIEGPEGYSGYYYESIEGNEDLHAEILKKVSWAKEQNEPANTNKVVPELFSSLASFIIQKKWQTIEIKTTQTRSDY